MENTQQDACDASKTMGRAKINLGYYFGTTYRRKILDRLLEEHEAYYKGVVLDIGGRDRGKFEKPKDTVQKWIFADIEEKHGPDIILNVEDMSNVDNESIDVVSGIELFEHVERIEQALKECYRVLKKDGVIIISAPFLFPIHADPSDFQRWTEDKWKKELAAQVFCIEEFKVMGRYFTVLADMEKALVKSMPRLLRWMFYAFYPCLDLLTKFDKLSTIRKHRYLGKYTTGYFIVARK